MTDLITMMRERVGSSFDDEATFSGAEVEAIIAAMSEPAPVSQMTGALAAIAAERHRQIAKGYDAAHDDKHISGEIIRSEWGALARIQDALHAGRSGSVEGYQKHLIQAAAQIAAEYERIERATEGQP